MDQYAEIEIEIQHNIKSSGKIKKINLLAIFWNGKKCINFFNSLKKINRKPFRAKVEDLHEGAIGPQRYLWFWYKP